MPNSALSEIYFIAAMFVLTLIISSVAVYAFLKTFKREKQAREAEIKEKEKQKNAARKTKVETSENQ